MGNGVARIDEGWMRHSRPGILAAAPVRIAPAEELIWHRLFINERHRHDMSDVVHLILCLGDTLDWPRLVERTGPHWPLLLAQVLTFYLCLSGLSRQRARRGSSSSCCERARANDGRAAEAGLDFTRGPLISRFSFSIDVREWGFMDPSVGADSRRRGSEPAIRAIAEAAVWDERAEDAGSRRTSAPRDCAILEPAMFKGLRGSWLRRHARSDAARRWATSNGR